MNCLVCRKELKEIFPGSQHQPNGAVVFTCHGHYGSTVFDPGPGEGNIMLQIYMCDDCLKVFSTAGAVDLVETHTTPAQHTYTTTTYLWDGAYD